MSSNNNFDTNQAEELIKKNTQEKSQEEFELTLLYNKEFIDNFAIFEKKLNLKEEKYKKIKGVEPIINFYITGISKRISEKEQSLKTFTKNITDDLKNNDYLNGIIQELREDIEVLKQNKDFLIKKCKKLKN